MKRYVCSVVLFTSMFVLFTVLTVPSVMAETTDADAGDTISNQATIAYSVGGVAQDSINSNEVTFLVDHKVRPVVAGTANDAVVPGGTDEYLTFTVTNGGNTSNNPTVEQLAIRLAAEADGGDDFDLTTVRIFLESDGTAGLDTANDTEVTGAGLGYISLPRDTSATVYLVGNVPGTVTNGQTSVYYLVAQAWDAGANAVLARDTDGDDPAAVEVVWVDDTGPAPSGDIANDGIHSAAGTFTVQTAALAVVKTSTVEEDPVNGTTNPLRIPRARVRYSVAITNNGAADATGVAVVDPVPAGTNYIVGSHTGAGSVAYSSDGGATYGYTPSGAGEDEAITHVRLTLPANIAAGGGSATVSFDVFIE